MLGRNRRAALRDGKTGGRKSLCCVSSASFFVGGNWKSNGTKASINQLIGGLNQGLVDTSAVDVVIAPTFLHLDYVQQHIDRSKYKVAAQNVWLKGPGAYTGEITVETLQDIGISWTITGHSERRALCGETSEVVAAKTRRALELGMSVIPCIGETLDERQGGRMFDVLTSQVQALVDHQVFGDDVDVPSRVVLAYEPVWAIGTGQVASPEQAQEVHAFLRQLLGSKLGRELASKVRILYGGSVNDKNCLELASKPDVNGFLVGGASLQADSFLTIIAAASAKKRNFV